MKKRLQITTRRTAKIFEQMLAIRRVAYADDEFFRMDEFWEDLCADSDKWSIKRYRSDTVEDYKRKAGVIAFEDRVTLIADERLMENARRGCPFSNFILAHEAGHLGLDHHAKSGVIKNFQLFAGPNGMSNLPPTVEELEANYAAVFLQCGVALIDKRWEPMQLARRAYCEVRSVKKAQRLVQLEVFQRELNRPKPKSQRVIL
ncbi:hypothetical protein [Pseudooceanicola sp.]|uniref:hypothetical protein n=1 Tax=Pseudooceanicola sp. TaxID=1914328 RepID=UPI0026368831|nr:hypothetical protein [Pseudooceanicola sp.]MDF1855430.1 hypothetical protein [Pseudooceanicola sp.]